jgi:hypothetical protein
LRRLDAVRADAHLIWEIVVALHLPALETGDFSVDTRRGRPESERTHARRRRFYFPLYLF